MNKFINVEYQDNKLVNKITIQEEKPEKLILTFDEIEKLSMEQPKPTYL